MSTKASLVLDFSGVQTGAQSGSFILDWEKNKDSNNNEKTSFFPSDTVFLLFQPAKGLAYDDMYASVKHGRIASLGPVDRTVQEAIDFTAESPGHTVQYRPTSNRATVDFDGKTPSLSVNSDTGIITASGDLPAIGTLSYKSQFLSFQFTPPPRLVDELQAKQDTLGSDNQAVYNVLMTAYDKTKKVAVTS
jgi:hypothetical protein